MRETKGLGVPSKGVLAGRLIKGWSEALQLMSPGDRWMLYIPAELGYGEQGLWRSARRSAWRYLIFDVELISMENTRVV